MDSGIRRFNGNVHKNGQPPWIAAQTLYRHETRVHTKHFAADIIMSTFIRYNAIVFKQDNVRTNTESSNASYSS